jgi:hypothetical protein
MLKKSFVPVLESCAKISIRNEMDRIVLGLREASVNGERAIVNGEGQMKWRWLAMAQEWQRRKGVRREL